MKEIPLNGVIEYIDTFMLTMAMTALGTDTSFDKFRQAGAKPFVLAFGLYIWLVVGDTSSPSGWCRCWRKC